MYLHRGVFPNVIYELPCDKYWGGGSTASLRTWDLQTKTFFLDASESFYSFIHYSGLDSFGAHNSKDCDSSALYPCLLERQCPCLCSYLCLCTVLVHAVHAHNIHVYVQDLFMMFMLIMFHVYVQYLFMMFMLIIFMFMYSTCS